MHKYMDIIKCTFLVKIWFEVDITKHPLYISQLYKEFKFDNLFDAQLGSYQYHLKLVVC